MTGPSVEMGRARRDSTPPGNHAPQSPLGQTRNCRKAQASRPTGRFARGITMGGSLAKNMLGKEGREAQPFPRSRVPLYSQQSGDDGVRDVLSLPRQTNALTVI